MCLTLVCTGAQHTLAHQDKGTGGQYWSSGCTCTSVHVGICGGFECGVHVHCMLGVVYMFTVCVRI